MPMRRCTVQRPTERTKWLCIEALGILQVDRATESMILIKPAFIHGTLNMYENLSLVAGGIVRELTGSHSRALG